MAIVCEPFVTLEEFFGTDCDCRLDPEGDAVVIEEAILAASEELALLSGHTVIGLCTDTLNYCRSWCWACRSWGMCGCWIDTLPLPGPVAGIVSVTVEGVPVPASELRLRDNEHLYRVDAAGMSVAWPRDTVVTYRKGQPIPGIAKSACYELTCEILKRAKPRGDRLGPDVTSLSRQGVTMNRATASAVSDATGRAAAQFPMLARFLTTFNPTRANHPTFVWSPDSDECFEIHSDTPVAFVTP